MNSITEIFTHDWDMLGHDRIHRWTNNLKRTEQIRPQNEDKRPVSIHISSWVGTCIGEKHYTLRIKEHDNMWWSESENAWVHISCDSQASGFNMTAECYSLQEAVKLAKATIDTIFSKKGTKKRSMWQIDDDQGNWE